MCEIEEYYCLLGILADWTNSKYRIPEKFTDLVCGRLALALKDIRDKKDACVSKGDIAGLLRDFLENYKIKETIYQKDLIIPKIKEFPDIKVLEESFFKVHESDDSFMLKIIPWTPDWLEKSKVNPPLEKVYSEKIIRPNFECDIDPVVQKLTGFEKYKSQGQMAAVHAMLNSVEGSSLVTVLPTGSGKSILTQLAALMNSGEAETVIVVVPTISLAIDQAEQFNKLMPEEPIECVYVSGTDIRNEKIKENIREKLRHGRQRIVFTSPEAILTSLFYSVCECARRGYLSYFIIDETHIVEEWGNSFRPDFQRIAALRKTLWQISPENRKFKSIYLTATLTEDTYKTISNLFNGDAIPYVWSNYIRPEQSYWVHKAKSYDDKINKLKELLRVLPRPFIFYILMPEGNVAYQGINAQRAKTMFDELGIKRVRIFTGQTSLEEREKIISLWKIDEIDCVIATSAFGVGMDKSDIRSIVHACIPESIDRYYQEVSRAGRDGRACLSFVIYTQEDIESANKLATDKIITPERAKVRWESLLAKGKNVKDGVLVDLNTVPPDGGMNNEHHKEWNLKTLLLMNRAGLIEIEIPDVGFFEEREDGNLADELENNADSIYISLNKSITVDIWENEIVTTRTEMIETNRTRFNEIQSLFRNNDDYSAMFAERYQFFFNIPDHSCGGCPVCRRNPNSGKEIMEQTFCSGIEFRSGNENLSELDIDIENSNCYISYNYFNEEDISRIVGVLMEYGNFTSIVSENDRLREMLQKNININSTMITHISKQYINMLGVDQNIIRIYSPESKYLSYEDSGRLKGTIFIIPEDIALSDTDNRRIIDLKGNKFSIEEILERYNTCQY
jgi:RecQ family ATP-dependent DNA helicase